MIRKIAVVLLLFIVSHPFAQAESSFSQESPFQIVKNRLASVEDRKKAIDQLKTSTDSGVTLALGDIIRDPEESIALRAHVTDVLSESKDQWATLELTKTLKDSSVPSENRILALYALWKKDAQGIRAELINLAQSSGESTDMRVAALNYLRRDKGKWPSRFWEDLFLKKGNPAPLRIQAMNGMTELGLITQPEITLIPIIENPGEPAELRKAVILIVNSMVSQEALEKAFLSVLSKSENPLEMRRFALDNLALTPNKALLSELKLILSRESDVSLAGDLKALIAALASQN